MNEIIKAMEERRSIRKFKEDMPAKEDLEQIIEAGLYAANGMGITGWAKNEWDGSVEMEAQGTIAQINMMLKMINKSDYIVIDTIETKDIPLEEHETGFYVR